MNASKPFKLVAGLMLVIAVTAFTQTTDHTHGAVVFLVAGATFLMGYFAGEDI
ncbi:hypothetical protein QZH45_09610 [Pseudomonas corrugata]|uniref:hypothetical protein n=1 Tax=Pseudomonas corrugata TaxID=47879 RepID=UPI003D8185F7